MKKLIYICVILLTILCFFENCGMDRLTDIGKIENHSKRSITVVLMDKNFITDSILYNRLGYWEYDVKSESLLKITTFGIPKMPNNYNNWYFYVFDRDTLLKYLYGTVKPSKESEESVKKAFLKIYKVSQESIKKENINLTYNE